MALRGLAAISNLITHPADVIRVRAIELLVAGGFRINELLTIPADVGLMFGMGRPHWSAARSRWKPSCRCGHPLRRQRGGPISVKWVTTPLADMVRRAVREIRSATEDARSVAHWMRNNPGRAWPGLGVNSYGLDDLISSFALTPVLGVKRSCFVCQWLRSHRVPHHIIGRRFAFRRRDVEAALLQLQPKSPMVAEPVRQEISDLLFVCFLNQFRLDRTPNRNGGRSSNGP